VEPAHASACPLCLTGARILLGGEMVDQPLTRADGRVAEGDAPELDLTGYLVLPGIIDLHGDGFERHLTPRPTTPFDKRGASAGPAPPHRPAPYRRGVRTDGRAQCGAAGQPVGQYRSAGSDRGWAVRWPGVGLLLSCAVQAAWHLVDVGLMDLAAAGR